MMKCSKCGCKNVLKADYCKSCGKKFTKKQKDEVYQKTLYFKINKLKDIYDTITFSKLTSHPVFRGIVLFTIVFFGVYFLIQNGTVMKIEKSENYEIYYSQNDAVYYLVTDNDTEKVFLNMYIPNYVKKINISHYLNDGSLIDQIDYENGDKISLETYHDDYYVITSSSSHEKMNTFKVFLYHKEDVKKIEKYELHPLE